MNKIFLGLTFSFILLSCNKSEKEQNQNNEIVSSQNDSIVEEKIEVVEAPKFKLENIDGGFKSLEDYKGKLVFMDIWATWCGPCIAQIPYMKILEDKYKNEPIQFLSISVDPEKDKDKWRNMVKEKGMIGDQLFAGSESQFPIDYKVEFLPRFVLISAEGKILMDNTPQVINADGDAVNEDIVKIIDFSLDQMKKASQ